MSCCPPPSRRPTRPGRRRRSRSRMTFRPRPVAHPRTRGQRAKRAGAACWGGWRAPSVRLLRPPRSATRRHRQRALFAHSARRAAGRGRDSASSAKDLFARQDLFPADAPAATAPTPPSPPAPAAAAPTPPPPPAATVAAPSAAATVPARPVLEPLPPQPPQPPQPQDSLAGPPTPAPAAVDAPLAAPSIGEAAARPPAAWEPPAARAPAAAASWSGSHKAGGGVSEFGAASRAAVCPLALVAAPTPTPKP